jgi:hypothetical protein
VVGSRIIERVLISCFIVVLLIVCERGLSTTAVCPGFVQFVELRIFFFSLPVPVVLIYCVL